MGFLDPIFQGLSWAGSLGLVWIALAALLAIWTRTPRTLLLVAAATAIANLTAYWLKLAVDRPRPPLRFPEPEPLVRVPGDPAFPSGHAAMAFACALLLSWARPRLWPAFFALAVAIGWSRVYVGVHYPLDVLGGAVLGLAVATALRLLAEAPRRSARRPRRG